MKYEHVDMDSCFLSEKHKPSIQPEDTEIQPELQSLPVPLRPLTDTKKVSITAKLYCVFQGKYLMHFSFVRIFKVWTVYICFFYSMEWFNEYGFEIIMSYRKKCDMNLCSILLAFWKGNVVRFTIVLAATLKK